jgi:hypothetical protein
MRWQVAQRPAWTSWFAWHPVRVGSEWVWWETVERQAMGGGAGDYVWYYRLPEPFWTDEDRREHRKRTFPAEGY